MKKPICLVCLTVAMLSVAPPASALLMTFSDTSYDRTDFTVDWSDWVVTRSMTCPEFWPATTEKAADPVNYLNFLFMPADIISFTLYFDGTRPIIEGLNHYDIWNPEFISLVSVEEFSIRFRIDRNRQVPDAGATSILLAIGTVGLYLFRRFH